MSRTSRIGRRAVASASVTVLSDNAATFVAGTQNNNVSSRPRTTAPVVGWKPPQWTTVGAHGVDQRTPELKAVVQEIVNRSRWSSGNAMAIIVTGTRTRTASVRQRRGPCTDSAYRVHRPVNQESPRNGAASPVHKERP